MSELLVPVVGIPYLHDFSLLDACIKSVNRPGVVRIHVIDNSPELERIEYHDGKVVVTRPWRNLGVGASWNLIIKANPWARWWCILNADVEMADGDLEELTQQIKFHDVVTFSGMHAFGIRASAIQKVGWFDENFVPGYFEDNDYHYRCQLMGVSYHQIVGGLVHHGSMVIKGSERYRTENSRTFPQNRLYYEQKWGGPVGAERFTTPFDRGGSPRDWTLDMTRLKNLAWKE